VKRLRGSAWLSRVQSTLDPDSIRIAIVDKLSARQVFEVKLPVEALGDLLTSQAVNCEFILLNKEKIGRRRETKSELVELPAEFHPPTDVELAEALKPFEANGWVGSVWAMKNHRRHATRGNKYFVSVPFERWVEREPEATA